CAGLLYPVTLAERTVSHLRNAPVAALLDAPALDGEQARRGQLRYAPKDRLRRRDVAEIEIGMQRRAIDFRRDARQREERFRLGRERDPARIPIDVDRLDAQAVAADHEAPPARVPQREAEHAVQPLDKFIAVLRVAMKEHFAVRTGLEVLALRL